MLICTALFWSIGSVYSKQFKATGCIATHIGIQMLALLPGEGSQVNLSLKGIGSILCLTVILAYSCYIYVLERWPCLQSLTLLRGIFLCVPAGRTGPQAEERNKIQ